MGAAFFCFTSPETHSADYQHIARRAEKYFHFFAISCNETATFCVYIIEKRAKQKTKNTNKNQLTK